MKAWMMTLMGGVMLAGAVAGASMDATGGEATVWLEDLSTTGDQIELEAIGAKKAYFQESSGAKAVSGTLVMSNTLGGCGDTRGGCAGITRWEWIDDDSFTGSVTNESGQTIGTIKGSVSGAHLWGEVHLPDGNIFAWSWNQDK